MVIQDRITRIEQAVDAIAIEVERMSEGQRYTTRVLAEQFGERARIDGGSSQSLSRGGEGTNGNGGGHAR